MQRYEKGDIVKIQGIERYTVSHTHFCTVELRTGAAVEPEENRRTLQLSDPAGGVCSREGRGGVLCVWAGQG